MKTNVLFATADPNRAALIVEGLSSGGMSVTVSPRFKEALGLVSHKACDLLMVGQKLADGEGLDLVRGVRSGGPARQMPIVALVEQPDAPAPAERPKSAYDLLLRKAAAVPEKAGTANSPRAGIPPAFSAAKDKLSLRLAFFQAGADECLSLGWEVAECVARIKAVLRRVQTQSCEEIIRTGEIELNLTSYILRVAGRKVPLTSKELDLLYVFLSSPNRVLSRPYLIERVWGYNYFGSPRTVDVHVRRLREKLGRAARFITTVPCVGYKMVPPARS